MQRGASPPGLYSDDSVMCGCVCIAGGAGSHGTHLFYTPVLHTAGEKHKHGCCSLLLLLRLRFWVSLERPISLHCLPIALMEGKHPGPHSRGRRDTCDANRFKDRPKLKLLRILTRRQRFSCWHYVAQNQLFPTSCADFYRCNVLIIEFVLC